MSKLSLYRSLTTRDALNGYPNASLFQHLLKLRVGSNGRKAERARIPCNPLILCLSLAHILETGSDYDDIAFKYARAYDFVMEESLDGFLSLLLHKGQAATIVRAEHLLEDLLQLCWASLTVQGFRIERVQRKPASIWDLAYASWAISNGTLYEPFQELLSDDVELMKTVKDSLMAFGSRHEKVIRQFRDKYEQVSDKMHRDLKEATVRTGTAESLVDLRAKQKCAEKIFHWCRRLCYWLPHNIVAFSVADFTLPEDIEEASGLLVPQKRHWLIPSNFSISPKSKIET